MSVQKKQKTNPAPAPQAQKAGHDPSADEIDQIMSEIEELQNEMAESTEPEPAPKVEKKHLKVVPGGNSAVAAAAEVEAAQEESILKEFQSGADAEASLESTLSELGDEPSAGNSLLEQMDAGTEPDLSGENSSEDEHEPGISREELEEQLLAEVAGEPEAAEDEEDEVTEEEILTEELEKPVVVNATPTASKKEKTMAPKNSATDGTMSMTVSGNMTLKIKYEFDGQEVTVGFADNFLHVELSDGTEFKIPVSRGNPFAGKKAA